MDITPARIYVYIDVRRDTNEVFYVGQGNKERCNNYRPSHRNKHHAAVVAMHGMIRFVVFSSDVFEEFESKNGKMMYRYPLIDAKEIELIASFNTFCGDNPKGCNMTRGGRGTYGYKPTDAERAHMREIALRRPPATDEVRAKLRAKLALRPPPSDKTRARLREAARRPRLPHTDATKAKIRAKRALQAPASDETREKLRTSALAAWARRRRHTKKS